MHTDKYDNGTCQSSCNQLLDALTSKDKVKAAYNEVVLSHRSTGLQVTLGRARLPRERDQRQGLRRHTFLQGSEQMQVRRAEQGPQETKTRQSSAGWRRVAKSAPAVTQAWGREGAASAPPIGRNIHRLGYLSLVSWVMRFECLEMNATTELEWE